MILQHFTSEKSSESDGVNDNPKEGIGDKVAVIQPKEREAKDNEGEFLEKAAETSKHECLLMDQRVEVSDGRIRDEGGISDEIQIEPVNIYCGLGCYKLLRYNIFNTTMIILYFISVVPGNSSFVSVN